MVVRWKAHQCSRHWNGLAWWHPTAGHVLAMITLMLSRCLELANIGQIILTMALPIWARQESGYRRLCNGTTSNTNTVDWSSSLQWNVTMALLRRSCVVGDGCTLKLKLLTRRDGVVKQETGIYLTKSGWILKPNRLNWSKSRKKATTMLTNTEP